MKPWLWVCLVCVGVAQAASRPAFGGKVRLSSASSWTTASLESAALCRLEGQKVVPVLAKSVVQVSPTRLRIELRPHLKTAAFLPFTSRELIAEWNQWLTPTRASPARGLLWPMTKGGKLNGVLQSPQVVELELAFPLKDAVKALCHPLLAFKGQGPFRRKSDTEWEKNLACVEGRPYLDGIELAGGLKADLQEGAFDGDASFKGPLLFATYLGFHPERLPPGFKDDFTKFFDREELSRVFIKGHSGPLTDWLPMASGPRPPWSKPSPIPKRTPLPQEWLLLYDEAVPEHKMVARRLQVKLFELGHRVLPKPVPYRQLQARWEIGDFDLMLHSLFLSPAPSVARTQLFHLSKLEVTPQARLEEGPELPAEAPLIPLYAQGLRFQVPATVWGFSLDDHGLPRLDTTFFPTEP